MKKQCKDQLHYLTSACATDVDYTFIFKVIYPDL